MAYARTAPPRVYCSDIDDAAGSELLGNFPGMSFAPRFSPDGSTRRCSAWREGGDTNIFAMDVRGRRTSAADQRQRHRHLALLSRRTAAQIVFNSDRGGTPAALRHGRRRRRRAAHQLRRRPLRHAGVVAARRPHRLHQDQGRQFHIGVMRPDGSGERLLTSSYWTRARPGRRTAGC